MNRSILVSVLVLVAATLPFLGTIGHDFLNWDDPEYVTDNPLLQSGAGLVRIWTGFDNPQVYPLVFTTFWIEYRLWGARPAGYHAVNVALHALASLLLFRLLRRLPLPPWVAPAAAVLFALHPTQVASVAWVAERKNVLSAVFYFACLSSYLRAMTRGGRRDLALSLLFAILATLSKTTAVTIPLTLVLLETFFGEAESTPLPSRAAILSRRSLLRLAPFAAFALLMAALTVFREHGPSVTSDAGLGDRILIASRAFWFYVGKLLVPVGLAGVYPRWSIPSCRIPGALGLALLVALVLLAVRFRRRVPKPVLFGAVQFAVAGLPTSGLIPFGYLEKSLVADHFLYLPAWGFWVFFFSTLAWIQDAAARTRGGSTAARWRASAVAWAALILALIFAPASAAHARVWKDTPTFWNHVLERDPASWLAYGNRGQWHASRGELPEALQDLTEAIRLRPRYVEANFNRAWVLDRMGRTEEAERAYLRTLELSPLHPDAHNNLGVLYLRAGRVEAAVKELEAAVDLDPKNEGFAKNLRLARGAESAR